MVKRHEEKEGTGLRCCFSFFPLAAAAFASPSVILNEPGGSSGPLLGILRVARTPWGESSEGVLVSSHIQRRWFTQEGAVLQQEKNRGIKDSSQSECKAEDAEHWGTF